ncbi:SRPBCC family protein [Streptomyces salinarius]|uniref:SRPBCC family protein n=1 Tax=Streptomyces salinarius TaxID=2762598 RepID=UPI0013D91753|nr:SRPBCC family protein [Streptomyces salinarius]
MTTIEETVRVAVPVRTVYDQWTQFKTFPRFMTSVVKVEQVRPSLTRWTLGVGPVRHEFAAEIVEQQPDARVAWRSLDGRHRGEVTFHATAPDRTAVTVHLRIVRPGAAVLLCDTFGLVRRVLRTELAHFREFVEGLGEGNEGWRGTIRNGHVRPVESEPPRSHVPRWPVG